MASVGKNMESQPDQPVFPGGKQGFAWPIVLAITILIASGREAVASPF